MNKACLIRNISKAFVIAEYLRTIYLALGSKNYEASFIRLEHGTGRGFFGVSNTGSYDCLKETLRGITDGLDLKFSTITAIKFLSESCLSLAIRNRDIHRIEHTIEIWRQYEELERRFICNGEQFTVNALGRWFVENQIVCLIEQVEQVGQYSSISPFGKYSCSVFYQGCDVSDYTHEQIRELNKVAFKYELDFIDNYDFDESITKIRDRLIKLGQKHCLPPLDFAICYATDEMRLLDRHYQDKRDKRITPGSRYYSEADMLRYSAWKHHRDDPLIPPSYVS